MIYRMRIYAAIPENVDAFNTFFLRHLLPVQQRHGARLIGRWLTEDSRIVALWEYDDREAYERVQAAVDADADTELAKKARKSLPPLFSEMEEVFMTSTLPTAG